MSAFRTILPDAPQDLSITHQSGVCLMGSCFAEHIGEQLEGAKFNLLQNPFGILYNPISIAESLERIVANKSYVISDLVEQSGRWVSFAHHGRFADLDATLALKKINESLEVAHRFLKEAKVLFISLGTAKVYRLKESNRIVANCHKFPASNFEHLLLEKSDIVTVFAKAINQLKSFNPQLNIIFTVSPVRHLRDGFVENQWSKSTLLLAVKTLQSKFSSVGYFPSYELMLDDLRDYRFYESDLLHPNRLAVEYIFSYFDKLYFDDATRKVIQDVQKIRKAVEHRPFNPLSEAYQTHLKRTIQKINEAEQQYPFLDFRAEKKMVAQQLI